ARRQRQRGARLRGRRRRVRRDGEGRRGGGGAGEVPVAAVGGGHVVGTRQQRGGQGAAAVPVDRLGAQHGVVGRDGDQPGGVHAGDGRDRADVVTQLRACLLVNRESGRRQRRHRGGGQVLGDDEVYRPGH